MSQAGGVPLSM